MQETVMIFKKYDTKCTVIRQYMVDKLFQNQ